MELDITTLENTYLFLKELDTQGFISYKLVFKVVSRITGKIIYHNFNSLEDFATRYSSILTNNSPNRYCIVGDFVFLENIKFVNKAVTYTNNLFYYNVSSGAPYNKIDIQYNNTKNAFYNEDVKKFVAYLSDMLIAYTIRNNYLMDARLNSYVDACYVDPGYVGDANFVPTDSDTGGLE